MSYKAEQAQLWNVADLVAKDWFRQACRNPYGKFSLWYRLPVAGEKMSLPIASVDAPNDSYMASIAISAAWTKEIATRKIVEAMRTLPLYPAN